MTAPRPDGTQAARCMRIALAEARVTPDEVGYINAHGSSTPLNDPTETSAIKQVFGDHAYRLAVSGTKGYYGHALGACGAIEAAICALASSRGWLPPTVNLETPDPACDLDYVTGDGRALRPRVPAEQLVRLRRDQRGAGVSPGGRLDSPPFSPSQEIRCLRCFAAPSPRPSAPSPWCSSVSDRWQASTSPTPPTACFGIAVAHAVVLSVMITATMAISGGHLNPAVTIGLWSPPAERTSRTAGAYIVAQLVGAVVARAAVKWSTRSA